MWAVPLFCQHLHPPRESSPGGNLSEQLNDPRDGHAAGRGRPQLSLTIANPSILVGEVSVGGRLRHGVSPVNPHKRIVATIVSPMAMCSFHRTSAFIAKR